MRLTTAEWILRISIVLSDTSKGKRNQKKTIKFHKNVDNNQRNEYSTFYREWNGFCIHKNFGRKLFDGKWTGSHGPPIGSLYLISSTKSIHLDNLLHLSNFVVNARKKISNVWIKCLCRDMVWGLQTFIAINLSIHT